MDTTKILKEVKAGLPFFIGGLVVASVVVFGVMYLTKGSADKSAKSAAPAPEEYTEQDHAAYDLQAAQDERVPADDNGSVAGQ
jgi:hypothetical protein